MARTGSTRYRNNVMGPTHPHPANHAFTSGNGEWCRILLQSSVLNVLTAGKMLPRRMLMMHRAQPLADGDLINGVAMEELLF